MHENISGGTTAPDSRSTDVGAPFSELDLALVDALQAAPRAPWSRIGRALGVDATTAARRWERLRANGLAWVSAYDSAKAATVAYVEVQCRPRAVESVGAALADMPWVFSVDETAGDFDLLASVVAADLPALGRSVHGLIGGLKGVRSTRTRLGITLYSEGGDWRMRAMEPSGHAELSAPRTSRPTPYSAHMHHRPPPEDQALLEALGRDGRLGYTDLGTATGMSEHTARRRLQRMIRDRDITFRCDLAHPSLGSRQSFSTAPQSRTPTSKPRATRWPERKRCAWPCPSAAPTTSSSWSGCAAYTPSTPSKRTSRNASRI